MEKIKLRVTGNQIEVIQRPAVITAGTVGLAVEFSFDSQWEKLAKTAVFKAGDKVVATMPEKDTCSVPWEVLEKPNVWLHIGVYGANGDGTAVIPTLWAKVVVIHTGADPEGDPALEPTAPVWQAVLSRLEGITAEGVGAATREEMDVVQDHLFSLNDEFYSHRENLDNPHGVTCDQILAVHVDELDGRVENVLFQHDLLLHATEKDNPHRVTPAQIGAVPQTQHDEDVQRAMDEIALQVQNLEEQISARVGEIETALDGILAIQNELIGGAEV